ncbi:MAG: transposase [Rhodobacteraceae bacterium]|nr:transposase [Paracoccaceae bacterium]
MHLAVDATGLKVYGEGEWKVRVHGKDKRRVWRKLHLAVDTGTGALHAHALTVSEASDGANARACSPAPPRRSPRSAPTRPMTASTAMPPSSPATPGPVIPPRKGAAIRRPPRRQEVPPQAARRRPASPRSGATPGRQRAATTAAPSPRREAAPRNADRPAPARAVTIARGSRPPSPCAASTASPPLPCPEASGSPDPSRGKGAIQATSRPCNYAPILSYPIGRIGGREGGAGGGPGAMSHTHCSLV